MASKSTIAHIKPVTRGELGRAYSRYEERCLKNRSSLPSDAVQLVLENEGEELAQEMFESLHKRVRLHVKCIVRHVTVNRNLTPQQMIQATQRVLHIDEPALATMPRQGVGIEKFDMYFFPAEHRISNEEQEQMMAEYGLIPDYYGQTQANIDDPAFADQYPNAALWNLQNGQVSYVTFDGWDDERAVYCRRNKAHRWTNRAWFASRRK